MLCPQRFDLMYKYLYIKFREKKINSKFFVELYHKHLITFNNCYELPDINLPDQKPKKNIDDFINSFNNLIDNMKNIGYDENFPIPIGNNNIIINGTHRLMISYYYKITPSIIQKNENGNPNYNYNFFLNRTINPSLDRIYTDPIALEYVKHNPNIRTMIIYPIAYYYNKLNEVMNMINNYGYIYYQKTIDLNKNGVSNLIKEIYRHEEWIGGSFPSGFSPGGKAQRCVSQQSCYTVFLLIHINDLSKCIELKEKCRGIFGIGKHSLHLSDSPNDTFRISCALLNENSIDFLNKGTNDITNSTKLLLTNYFDKLKSMNTLNNNSLRNDLCEDYCLTSSLIMEMFNLRQAKDIDYLHKEDNELGLENVGVHKGKWLSYYHIHKDEIIYNPKYHFYFNGFKFASLEVIKRMKENRNEPKDIKDIKLID